MNTPSERILLLLTQLYAAEQVQPTYTNILELVSSVTVPPERGGDYFSERSITLITYGDTLQNPGEAPLKTLHRFLRERLSGNITTLHILPFYPYSSDDGFSVIDYYAVNPQLGTWDDLQAVGSDFRLMFDAVINHMSAQSPWFQAFLSGDESFAKLFFTAPPETDLRNVTRPRATPVLTAFQTADSTLVHVWTTFSADQVDLDYRHPETLLRILRVLLFYVEQGADVLRLDAIAYLWKQAGTTCIHRPETHTVIELIRAVLDLAAPHVILITETNVPHTENISYFGDGTIPEAQLVYNFTLPPLLYYAMVSQDARPLANWINSLEPRPNGTAWFNFTASHDGIGVRPLEGILTQEQIQVLIHKTNRSGGAVSYKSNPDGTHSPYELNITYVDAVTNPDHPVELQARCFLVSQAVMLALAGVPAVYIHSLLGSRNDLVGQQRLGYNRAINRSKLTIREVDAELQDSDSLRSRIFSGYLHLIHKRQQSRAFHPNAGQTATVFNDGQVFALERITQDQAERVVCLFNITSENQTVATGSPPALDLLTGELCPPHVVLLPYQVRWLQMKTEG